MNKYDSFNLKRKVETTIINKSSSSPAETPYSTRRILSTPDYFGNSVFFVIKEMVQLISISVNFFHWINVLVKWHKR